MTPLVAGLGTPELLIILAVLVLLFGAAKLPELARGSGRALRIFKAETKGLMDDDDDSVEKSVAPSAKSTEELELEARHADERRLLEEQRRLEAERRGDARP